MMELVSTRFHGKKVSTEPGHGLTNVGLGHVAVGYANIQRPFNPVLPNTGLDWAASKLL